MKITLEIAKATVKIATTLTVIAATALWMAPI